MQIFIGKDQYLSSLQQYVDQAIAGQLEKHVLKPICENNFTPGGEGGSGCWASAIEKHLAFW